MLQVGAISFSHAQWLWSFAPQNPRRRIFVPIIVQCEGTVWQARSRSCRRFQCFLRSETMRERSWFGREWNRCAC